MTREEARLAGLKRYNSGKPCPKGHEPIFSVNNYGCCECQRIRDAARYAKQRAELGNAPVRNGARNPIADRPKKQMAKEAIENRSRARGVQKAKTHGDGRTETEAAAAASFMNSYLVVPDFLARAEARIQAARAGS